MQKEPTFGALEVFSQLDRLYDEDENWRAKHREDCPCHPSYSNPHKLTTFCVCKELNKADRDAYLEEKADEARKYG